MSKAKSKSAPVIVNGSGRPTSPQARGPVYEIRMALSDQEGKRVSRKALAERIGCSEDTIERAELAGTLPASPAVQSNLHALAPLISEREAAELKRRRKHGL